MLLSLMLASSLAAFAPAPAEAEAPPPPAAAPQPARVCAMQPRFVPAGKLPHGIRVACTRSDGDAARPDYPVRRTAPNRTLG